MDGDAACLSPCKGGSSRLRRTLFRHRESTPPRPIRHGSYAMKHDFRTSIHLRRAQRPFTFKFPTRFHCSPQILLLASLRTTAFRKIRHFRRPREFPPQRNTCLMESPIFRGSDDSLFSIFVVPRNPDSARVSFTNTLQKLIFPSSRNYPPHGTSPSDGILVFTGLHDS